MEYQDSQHRRELNLRVNASPVADTPWRATAFPTLQHPQSAPSESSHRRPDPSQAYGYSGVVQDEGVSDWHRDFFAFTGTDLLVPFLVHNSGFCW